MEPRLIARVNDRSEFELHANYPLRLRHARGTRIEALSGIIWITAYNEGTDFELRPGQVFIVPNDRLALIESVARGVVRVEPQPALAGLSRLLTQLLARRVVKGKRGAACTAMSSR